MIEKLIDNENELSNLVSDLLKEQTIAIDTESNSFFGYPEKVCLIQVATNSDTWIIDPLSINNMNPLRKLLESQNVQKIIHAAENDLRVIDRDWKFNIRNIFDTSIAAKFCGYERTGLEVVLERTIGVVIEKNKKLQRANWGLRPLSPEALNYAETDVIYLVKLRDGLIEKLEELGRLAWTTEEFKRIENVRYNPPSPPELAFFSMKGSYSLRPKELSVLKAVYEFRDLQARKRDIPPFKLLSNEVLLFLSKNPYVPFDKVSGLSRKLSQQFLAQLKNRINDGLKGDGISRPNHEKRDKKVGVVQYAARFKELKKWREDIGKKLDLDPPLIWPTNSLNQLARVPDSIDTELLESRDVRVWQKGEFGGSIRNKLDDL
ncbi:MAG: ribonuclease D [Dehalococcoidia bacterium]